MKVVGGDKSSQVRQETRWNITANKRKQMGERKKKNFAARLSPGHLALSPPPLTPNWA